MKETFQLSSIPLYLFKASVEAKVGITYLWLRKQQGLLH